MSKEIRIEIPNIQSIKLLQLNSLKYIQGRKQEELCPQDMINFVHYFCNVPKEDLERAKMGSLIELFYKCVELFNEFKVRETPQQEIQVKGKAYTLRTPSNDLPASWFTTSQAMMAKGIESNEIAALCYVEKGVEYNQRDKKNKRKILNPFKERSELFLKHMKAVDYMPLNAFFLEKYKKYKRPFLIIQKRRMMENEVLRKQ